MDLKQVIAQNLAALRKEARLTQAELAEKINYTDKAVSKWERGESLPDIEILKAIADLFGVTVDYLVQAEHPSAKPAAQHTRIINNRIVITCLAVTCVWLIAIILNFSLGMRGFINTWWLFVGAVPVSFVVLLVFNSVWGKKKFTFMILTFLVWTTLAFFYIVFLQNNLLFLFYTGIPLQVMIILWSRLRGK